MKLSLESLRGDTYALLDPDAERQLQDSRARARRPLAGRELIGEGVAAGGFLATAVAMLLLLPWQRPLDVPLGLALLLAYAIASRVRLEIGPGFTDPTQLVLVPMLFAMPTPLVPLLVAIGCVLGEAPEYARWKAHPSRALVQVANSWHSVGPALVLIAAGVTAPTLDHWPVYLVALAAQYALDIATTTPRESFELGVSPRSQLPSVAWTFAVDALLSPLGLLAAMAGAEHPFAFLLVLPLIALVAIFAGERQARLDGALQLSDAYRGTTMVLADFVETDDEYTGAHSRSVVLLALQVADRLGVAPRERRMLEFGALLHDVGKIAVPKEVINKPGPLSPEEWDIIKMHTVEGQLMLQQVGGLLVEVGRVVRSTHERWDGGGYPDGLAGEAIPVEARIVACCDAYSAMTTRRAYRAAMPEEAAVAELRANAGTQFDPRVVDALLEALEETSLELQDSPEDRSDPAPAPGGGSRRTAPSGTRYGAPGGDA